MAGALRRRRFSDVLCPDGVRTASWRPTTSRRWVGGEGLGIPSPLPGCHFRRSCSVSACCLRRTLWLLGLVASVSCVLLARLWIRRRCFWLLCHTFPCEGRPRILRSIHDLTVTCLLLVSLGKCTVLDFSGYDTRECSLFVVYLLRQRIQVHVSDYGGWFAGDDIYAAFPSLPSGSGCAASCAVWTRRTVLQRNSALSVEPLVSGSHVQCLLRRRHTGIGSFGR